MSLGNTVGGVRGGTVSQRVSATPGEGRDPAKTYSTREAGDKTDKK